MIHARARSRRNPLIASLLLALALVAPAADADVKLGPFVASGELQAGWQNYSGQRESSEFEEYRDERSWITRGRLQLEDEGGRYFLRSWFDEVGQGDQRYRLELGRWGRWEAYGAFSRLPHNFSNEAQSPYRGVRDADLVYLPANGAASAAINSSLRNQDLDLRWLTGEGGVRFRLLENLEFAADYRLIDKRGTIFRGGVGNGFGGAGSSRFALFASPVEEKIHEWTADADWSSEIWSIHANYTGNRYENHFESLIVDNFRNGVDAAGESARWRLALAPDNDSHNFSLVNSVLLPVGFPARLAATFSYGLRRQDEDFIPQSANSLVAGNPLLLPSQSDLDGRVETIMADVRLATRPLPDLNVDFHYRYYEYDNESDVIGLLAEAAFDSGGVSDAVPGLDRFSVPNDYDRQEASVKASYRILDVATFGLGYDWEQWHRSDDRPVTRTDEHGPTAWLDVRPVRWAQIRTRYTYKTRSRSDYQPFDYLEATFNPAGLSDPELAIFPELRKYDLAARKGHEGRFTARFMPCEMFDLGLNAGADYWSYGRSDYGLVDDERWYAGFDAGFRPHARVDLSVYYTYDRWLLEQDSRFRNVVGFGAAAMLMESPLGDWNSRTAEKAHNVGAEIGLTLIPDRLDATAGYAFQRGTVRTRQGGPQTETVFTEPAVDWPKIKNELHNVYADLTLRITENLKVQTHYRYETYHQSDFQFDNLRPFAPSVIDPDQQILLGNEVEDYRVHVYGASLILEF